MQDSERWKQPNWRPDQGPGPGWEQGGRWIHLAGGGRGPSSPEFGNEIHSLDPTSLEALKIPRVEREGQARKPEPPEPSPYTKEERETLERRVVGRKGRKGRPMKRRHRTWQPRKDREFID